MMNNKIIFFIILAINFNINKFYSQSISGEIHFIKKNYLPKYAKVNEYNQKINEFSKSIKQTTNELEYILKLNNNESIFYLKPKLNIDDNNFLNMLISISGGGGIYYTNLKTKNFLHQVELGGQHFLIKERLDSVKWTFTHEKKYFGKYLCYKAITTKINENKMGVFKKEVVAWYCLDIPIHFGPIGYGNLPGLILELQIEKGATFTVDTIKLSPKEKIKIKKPKLGKIVSYVEFEKIAKQMYLNRKSGM